MRKNLQESFHLNADRSSETVADNRHFIKPGFPKPEPHLLKLLFCVVQILHWFLMPVEPVPQ